MALIISGCGGGGWGGASAPTARPIVTNTLRTFANGDSIQYTVSGTVSTGGTTLTMNGSGSFTVTTNASPLDPRGSKHSIVTTAINATFNNGTPFATTSQYYFSQTASGTMNVYGDPVSGWITTPASGFVPSTISPISSPSSWVNNYTQQNGDTTNETISVPGRAVVSTGMGSFETYKITTSSTINYAAGGTDVTNETDYVVPSIGPVKIVINTTSTDAAGAVTTLSITLTATTTNIPF